jgi:phage repressor protein C with HTH and peptisase S24 domain
VVLGGTEGAVDLNLEGLPLEYVRRPLSLVGRGDIYALHVEGNSMFPAYRPGETILVWGAKPALVGRDVVVQVRPKVDGDPPPAFLKTLIKRTATELTVEQYNPPRKRVFKLADVVAVHMVLTRDEML